MAHWKTHHVYHGSLKNPPCLSWRTDTENSPGSPWLTENPSWSPELTGKPIKVIRAHWKTHHGHQSSLETPSWSVVTLAHSKTTMFIMAYWKTHHGHQSALENQSWSPELTENPIMVTLAHSKTHDGHCGLLKTTSIARLTAKPSTVTMAHWKTHHGHRGSLKTHRFRQGSLENLPRSPWLTG